MTLSLRLPTADGSIETYTPAAEPPHFEPSPGRPRQRVAYAAAHVVADPLAENVPNAPAVIDWDATLAFRRHLWQQGFNVAEAMDTAQRGFGLDWPACKELISRTLTEARTVEGGPADRVACGAMTDQLLDPNNATLDDIVQAYLEQVEHIESHDGRAVIMCSRALAGVARSPDDYRRVYDAVLSQVRTPVILHWLGEMFDPQLAGYWGAKTFEDAAGFVASLIRDHAPRVEGIKMSLLDANKEVMLRRLLPIDVKMFTGDDFNYPSLIAGEDEPFGREVGTFSHALLGIFDAIAPVAASALHALDRGDRAEYDRLMGPTVPLSRHLFATPTFYYKTGVVFLAYLNGHQDHFRMIGGLESGRSASHLAELFRLADQAGCLNDPARAAARMRPVMALTGID
jgi:hypothetical protein